MGNLRDLKERLSAWDLEAGRRWDEWKYRIYVTYIDRWHMPGYKDEGLDVFILIILLFVLAFFLYDLSVGLSSALSPYATPDPPYSGHHQPGTAWRFHATMSGE